MVIDMKQTVQTRNQQLEEYRQILARVNISDKEKDEVIRVVEGIMQAFVDAAFDINPLKISDIQSTGKASQLNLECDNFDIGTSVSISTEIDCVSSPRPRI